MTKKKKQLVPEEMPEFDAGIASMAPDSKIFVDKSFEIATYIFRIMEAKGINQRELAEIMNKSEAEVSKMLSGMQNLTLRSLAKLEAALAETIICTPRHFSFAMPEIVNGTKKVTGVKAKAQQGHAVITYEPETKVIPMPQYYLKEQAATGS